MENLDVWSGMEKNKFILRWLTEDPCEGSRAILSLSTEKRLQILMEALNSGNEKTAIILKHPAKR